MSGTLTAPVTDAERVDVRRYCGYPAYGVGPTDDPFNRTFSMFPELEFRLSNMTDAELVVLRSRLSVLRLVEAAIEGAYDNLDTAKAAAWTHNEREVVDRTAHYRLLRRALCDFIGVVGRLGQSGASINLIV